MAYVLKDGSILTEEMIEEWGEAAERGELPGGPDDWEWVIKPPGRPQLYPNEELVTVAFKVPAAFRDLIDSKAKENEITRSDYLRKVVSTALSL
ncbi:MAG: hypothetical protein FWC86_06435 [Coriobacteriia bacterium]|nr:hypothetical protein [Coriobacteriia bacterium]